MKWLDLSMMLLGTRRYILGSGSDVWKTAIPGNPLVPEVPAKPIFTAFQCPYAMQLCSQWDTNETFSHHLQYFWCCRFQFESHNRLISSDIIRHMHTKCANIIWKLNIFCSESKEQLQQMQELDWVAQLEILLCLSAVQIWHGTLIPLKLQKWYIKQLKS